LCIPGNVQVVVIDLEVLPERPENVECRLGIVQIRPVLLSKGKPHRSSARVAER
jgi:hypothetical protein